MNYDPNIDSSHALARQNWVSTSADRSADDDDPDNVELLVENYDRNFQLFAESTTATTTTRETFQPVDENDVEENDP